MSVDLDLSGRTAVVTGGARGIGAAISALFAEAGARVVVGHLPIPQDIDGARKVKERIDAAGGTCRAGRRTSPRRSRWSPLRNPVHGISGVSTSS